jgi:hypothetical protein
VDLAEAAGLLRTGRDAVRTYIEQGIELRDGVRRHLRAVRLAHGFDISADDLDAFIADLEADDPGRHPPVSVSRELLIEAGWRCAVCKTAAPLEFHHIVPWAKLRHHDPQHMLAVCGTCHSSITRHGEPDTASQREIKRRLRQIPQAPSAGGVQPPLPVVTPLTVAAPPAAIPAWVPPSWPAAVPPPAANDFVVEVFGQECEFGGVPDEHARQQIEARLLSRNFRQGLSIEAQLVLRALDAAVEIRAARAGATGVVYCGVVRLIAIATELLVEHGRDPATAARAAAQGLEEVRRAHLATFQEEDEWRPGMASGSGWTEYVTISRAGRRAIA